MASGLISVYLGSGTAASRPATPSIGTGVVAFYYSTDTDILEMYVESAWQPVGGYFPIQAACSDESTALTVGTNKLTFRMPCKYKVLEVRGSLSTAQTSGSIFTVDINEAGVSILSTKLTIDNGEKTSTTAATPAVISDTTLADDAEITVDIDQVGDGTAKGLKITILGYKIP